MNVIRFTDLIQSGKVAGQRVFIRADLNVPQDDGGRITEDTSTTTKFAYIMHGDGTAVPVKK